MSADEMKEMKPRRPDEPVFSDDELCPEDFAAQWGCDPIYDKPPREPGDGYLFYNFSSESNDPEFLRKFIPAIERTIREIEHNLGGAAPCWSNDDLANMQAFLEYVRALLAWREAEK